MGLIGKGFILDSRSSVPGSVDVGVGRSISVHFLSSRADLGECSILVISIQLANRNCTSRDGRLTTKKHNPYHPAMKSNRKNPVRQQDHS